MKGALGRLDAIAARLLLPLTLGGLLIGLAFSWAGKESAATWFSVLTRQAIRRGVFRSVRELVARIDAFTASWNEGASPFVWVKTTDEILAKAVRKPRATSESGH